MQEDVLIVLNEREPLKRQMAEQLVHQLTTRQLSVKRLKPGTELAKIIAERKPRVLILDYLLGDMGTALDVLQFFQETPDTHSIQVVLWTDEPSVYAAVSAMKLGAKDYVEIGSPRAVPNVLRAVDACLKTSRSEKRSACISTKPTPLRLTFESEISRQCLAQADFAAKANKDIIVIYGERGCGRSSLARYIHHKRAFAGELIEINLDTWLGSGTSIFGSLTEPRIVPMLSYSATVVLDHAEFDTGELLEKAREGAKRIWGLSPEQQHPMLIVGTRCKNIADAWSRTLEAEQIEIPSLRERSDDLLPLLQYLEQEANSFGKANQLNYSRALLNELSNMGWPGNIKQLRAALLEVLSTPIETLRTLYEKCERKDSSSIPDSILGKEQRLLLLAVREAKLRWERFEEPDPELPSAKDARSAIEKTNGNIRAAAAMLGTGIGQLNKALALFPNQQLSVRNDK